jgi:hypothetical protein
MATQQEIDALLDQIKVPSAVRLAGGILAVEALFVALFAFQSVALITWRGNLWMAPAALFAPALAALVAAVGLTRARQWSLKAALLAGAVLLVADGAWLLLMFSSGVFSLLGIATVGGCLVSLLFAFLAMEPFAQVAAARRKLREAGYDVDL